MDPNNPNLNPKQEELVKRLEEIRRRRNLQGNKQESLESTVDKRSLEQQGERRNRNKNKQKRSSAKPKRNQPTRSSTKKNQQSKQTRQSEYKGQTSYPERTNQYSSKERIKQMSSSQQKQRNKNGSSLIEQLSDGDKLADAIILSEILSKPVALRKRYR